MVISPYTPVAYVFTVALAFTVTVFNPNPNEFPFSEIEPALWLKETLLGEVLKYAL